MLRNFVRVKFANSDSDRYWYMPRHFWTFTGNH